MQIFSWPRPWEPRNRRAPSPFRSRLANMLAGAPGYAAGETPDWSDPGYGRGIDTYYDRPDHPRDEAAIDDTSADSFPASDPPSWSGGATGAGAPEEGR